MNTLSTLTALFLFAAIPAGASPSGTAARCVSCGNVPTPGPIILPKAKDADTALTVDSAKLPSLRRF